MLLHERRARFVDERSAGGGHDVGVTRGLGHRGQAPQSRQIRDQRMNGVVTVELGFLERQQVVLLDEHLDAALETGRA